MIWGKLIRKRKRVSCKYKRYKAKSSGKKTKCVRVDRGYRIYIYKINKENELKRREWIGSLYLVRKR